MLVNRNEDNSFSVAQVWETVAKIHEEVFESQDSWKDTIDGVSAIFSAFSASSLNDLHAKLEKVKAKFFTHNAQGKQTEEDEH